LYQLTPRDAGKFGIRKTLKIPLATSADLLELHPAQLVHFDLIRHDKHKRGLGRYRLQIKISKCAVDAPAESAHYLPFLERMGFEPRPS
jgi:hypothetical protein